MIFKVKLARPEISSNQWSPVTLRRGIWVTGIATKTSFLLSAFQETVQEVKMKHAGIIFLPATNAQYIFWPMATVSIVHFTENLWKKQPIHICAIAAKHTVRYFLI